MWQLLIISPFVCIILNMMYDCNKKNNNYPCNARISLELVEFVFHEVYTNSYIHNFWISHISKGTRCRHDIASLFGLKCNGRCSKQDKRDSLTCHTYCDAGSLFIMVFFEDPWHSQPLSSVHRMFAICYIHHYWISHICKRTQFWHGLSMLSWLQCLWRWEKRKKMPIRYCTTLHCQQLLSTM